MFGRKVMLMSLAAIFALTYPSYSYLHSSACAPHCKLRVLASADAQSPYRTHLVNAGPGRFVKMSAWDAPAAGRCLAGWRYQTLTRDHAHLFVPQLSMLHTGPRALQLSVGWTPFEPMKAGKE